MVERNIQHIPLQKQPILQRIRSVKESEELDLIQACTITEKDSEEFYLS
jgi:hypothetical protein